MKPKRKAKPPKSTVRRNGKRRYSSSSMSWGLGFGVLGITATLILLLLKVTILNFMVDLMAHRPTEGDYAGNLVHRTVNEFNTVVENGNNRSRLLDRVSDPVVWYNKRYTHENFPSRSPYDRFEFVRSLEFDQQDPKTQNYEMRFDGMYRYRFPNKYLVRFESGTVLIQQGVITSLKSREQPNAYHVGWINTVYRYYLFVSLIAGAVLAALLILIPGLPVKLGELLVKALPRFS